MRLNDASINLSNFRIHVAGFGLIRGTFVTTENN